MTSTTHLPVATNWLFIVIQVATAGTLVSAVVLILARLLRRRSDPLSHGILFAGIIGLLTVPVLVGVGQSVPSDLFWKPAPDEEIVWVPTERLPELLERRQPEVTIAEDGTPWDHVAALALALPWAIGITVGLLRLSRSLAKQSRVLPGHAWQPEFWTEAYQDRLAQRLGLRRFPDVQVSPAVPMPMVVGFWRPRIVLPQPWPASWSPSQWEAVLLHEAAHIARRDQWALLAQRLAVILFWWCPLVHLLSRRLNELRENICDDYALQGPCDRIAYAELLVETAERLLDRRTVPVPLGLLDSARRGLEARVTRVLDKERRPMTRLTLPGKLLGAAFLAAACLLTIGVAALAQDPPQSPKKVHIKILVDGKEIDLTEERIQAFLAGEQKKTSPPKVRVEGQWEVVAPAKSGAATTKPDPRIEELVKQAEAIKPGSGAAVRRALQATPIRAKEKLKDPTVMTWRKDLNEVILNEVTRRLGEHRVPAALTWTVKEIDAPKASGAKPASKTPAASDLEALRVQVQQLSAELEALRKRLDAQKK
jgi:beta-lactamase regulating signal transducer with metallopeptidase domain